jgi:hypothetical protein
LQALPGNKKAQEMLEKFEGISSGGPEADHNEVKKDYESY